MYKMTKTFPINEISVWGTVFYKKLSNTKLQLKQDKMGFQRVNPFGGGWGRSPTPPYPSLRGNCLLLIED